jgi:hypothetical protein
MSAIFALHGNRLAVYQSENSVSFRRQLTTTKNRTMKGNMPDTVIQEEVSRTSPEVSHEAVQAVDRFIRETDWNAFWTRVVERTTPEVDAYERARVKSLQTAPQHVFM